MSNVPSGFSFALQTVLVAGGLLLSYGYSWAQTVQPESRELARGDPFAIYHAALTSAADSLRAAALRSVGKPNSATTLEPENGVAASGHHKKNGREQAISRVQQLRPVLEPILRDEGIPPGLAAVVLVESRGLATALSPKGARGIWQFMPDTARRYGLLVTPELDERLDIHKSTRAAARYLRDLYTQFESWQLALAAYNAGEDTVQRAIDRTSTRDFASIARRLPLETRSYVPAVLNAVAFIAGSEEGLTPPAARSAKRTTVYALAQME